MGHRIAHSCGVRQQARQAQMSMSMAVPRHAARQSIATCTQAEWLRALSSSLSLMPQHPLPRVAAQRITKA